jgi:hypothetical protein
MAYNDTGRMIPVDAILRAMRNAWSSASSSKWTPACPALGHCSPTSLVIQDVFGGNLLKTRAGDAWHFYNEIDGAMYDFTAEQFQNKPQYANLTATREEALRDCSEAQYRALSQRFVDLWRQH